MTHHLHRLHHFRLPREDGGLLEKALLVGGALAGTYVLYRLWERGKTGRHLVGAGDLVDCGPGAYWDPESAQCVPLALPPPVSPPAQCPPGQFYDYFQQMCVPLAGARVYGE